MENFESALSTSLLDRPYFLTVIYTDNVYLSNAALTYCIVKFKGGCPMGQPFKVIA